MIKLGVNSTSAVSEPSTAATAASKFPRFRDDAAFGAYGTHGRSLLYCHCVNMGIGQNAKPVCENIYLPNVSLGLTFAGLDAIKPPVISVSVANTSTTLMPGTTRSATTSSA